MLKTSRVDLALDMKTFSMRGYALELSSTTDRMYRSTIQGLFVVYRFEIVRFEGWLSPNPPFSLDVRSVASVGM